MEGRRYEQQLRLFLNEPGLLKHYLQRNNPQSARAQKLKTIFPPTTQLERFRHLEHARLSAQRDIELDGWVTQLITTFEDRVAACSRVDREQKFRRCSIQSQKVTCLGRLKMDYVEEQMSEHLVELQGLIRDYQHLGGLIGAEKGYVQRMIATTEVKKALVTQNSILRKENEMLKRQQEELDALAAKRKK